MVFVSLKEHVSHIRDTHTHFLKVQKRHRDFPERYVITTESERSASPNTFAGRGRIKMIIWTAKALGEIVKLKQVNISLLPQTIDSYILCKRYQELRISKLPQNERFQASLAYFECQISIPWTERLSQPEPPDENLATETQP